MTDGNCSGALTRKSGSTAGWRSCTEDGKMRCQMKSILMISWRWTQMRRGPRNYRAPWSHATTTRRTSPESCWRSCEASEQNMFSAGQVPAARGTWTRAPKSHSDQVQRRLSCWKNLLPSPCSSRMDLLHGFSHLHPAGKVSWALLNFSL